MMYTTEMLPSGGSYERRIGNEKDYHQLGRGTLQAFGHALRRARGKTRRLCGKS